ncbi:hypothetical protein GCM10022254_48950 [Actinomadura meridiana]|uniref:FxLD family lantipeptide n=1 Tax=Actinomadura meridiana TaxID=559626 RepID=A0ABP8CBS0_9ACTN
MSATPIETKEAFDLDVRNAFDLDVRVETGRVLPSAMGCNTDDGCGTTCEISACNSQQ